jgi:hypothetical protein
MLNLAEFLAQSELGAMNYYELLFQSSVHQLHRTLMSITDESFSSLTSICHICVFSE